MVLREIHSENHVGERVEPLQFSSYCSQYNDGQEHVGFVAFTTR